MSSKTSKIASLEAALLDTESSSLNPLADLVSLAQKSASDEAAAETTHRAIWSLYRVFATLLQRGILYGTGADKGKKEVRLWLYDRLDEFMALLAKLLSSEEPGLQVGANHANTFKQAG